MSDTRKPDKTSRVFDDRLLERKASTGGLVFPIRYMTWGFDQQYRRTIVSARPRYNEDDEYLIIRGVSYLEQTIRTVVAQTIDNGLVEASTIAQFMKSYMPTWDVVRSVAEKRYLIGEACATSFTISTLEDFLGAGSRLHGNFRTALEKTTILFHADPRTSGSLVLSDPRLTFAVLADLYKLRNEVIHGYGDIGGAARFQIEAYFEAVQGTMKACNWFLLAKNLDGVIATCSDPEADLIDYAVLEKELLTKCLGIEKYEKWEDGAGAQLFHSIERALRERTLIAASVKGNRNGNPRHEQMYARLLHYFMKNKCVAYGWSL